MARPPGRCRPTHRRCPGLVDPAHARAPWKRTRRRLLRRQCFGASRYDPQWSSGPDRRHWSWRDREPRYSATMPSAN